MGVNSKHIATFLLGAAAGLAAHKYMTMTDEEKEKMMADIKNKANSFKDEAEGAVEENLGDVENMFNDLFGKKNPEEKAV